MWRRYSVPSDKVPRVERVQVVVFLDVGSHRVCAYGCCIAGIVLTHGGCRCLRRGRLQTKVGSAGGPVVHGREDSAEEGPDARPHRRHRVQAVPVLCGRAFGLPSFVPWCGCDGKVPQGGSNVSVRAGTNNGRSGTSPDTPCQSERAHAALHPRDVTPSTVQQAHRWADLRARADVSIVRGNPGVGQYESDRATQWRQPRRHVVTQLCTLATDTGNLPFPIEVMLSAQHEAAR